MAYFRVTAASASNKYTGKARKVRLQVNAALTGTITLSDETGVTGTPVIAVITNPTVGSIYEYWDIINGVTITPSATCDVTLNIDTSYGPK